MKLSDAADKAYLRIEGMERVLTGLGEAQGVTVSDFDISLEELREQLLRTILNAQASFNEIVDTGDPTTSVNDLLDGIVAGAWHHGLITGLIKERG